MSQIKAKDVKIEEAWKAILKAEFEKPYFAGIKQFLKEEKAAGKIIYPPGALLFNAFNQTPFDAVKVVILGQDPYHGPGQAMGLSFSVPRGIPIPGSLRNMYKEIHRDLGHPLPDHGDLSSWAAQGVFLLNAMLTVEHRQAGSHKKIGWQKFTDAVISNLSQHKEGLVFLLWGNFAKSKKLLIDQNKHHVLEAVHPSPYNRDFVGCGHFSQANTFLEKQGKKPINWLIPK